MTSAIPCPLSDVEIGTSSTLTFEYNPTDVAKQRTSIAQIVQPEDLESDI